MALRRGLGLVLVLVVLAVLVSVAGITALWLVASRQPTVARESTLVLKLATDLHESSPDDVLRQVLGGGAPSTLPSIIENLRKAKVDRRVSSVLIVPTGLDASLWAKVQELRDAIIDFRKSGKSAIAYLEFADDKQYYLASACDRVYLMPTSQLDLNGLASYEVFLRGTLDKLDAYPDFLHVGQYKTAANQFTERGYTPQHRDMSESLNRDIYEQLIRGIAQGRRKTDAEVRALIDVGPFLAEDAVRAGLVDDVAYFDELDRKAKLPEDDDRKLQGADYAKVTPRSLGLGSGPKIGLIYAVGVIVSGESGYDPMTGPLLGSDTLIKHIREAREDSSLKAIVLRIDSPGGSAVASDAIWRELVITRDQKPDRPLIVSMSDLAASGGYYIAMASPYIVAQPGTLTGSIGVISGKIVTGRTYAKFGANIESVSSGRNAEIYSPARPFNESERAKIAASMQAFYDTFVEKAARSRRMPPERLDAIAQGRVWTGRQAREIGLVDELGGLDRAIAAAKQRAKIPADSEVEIVVYPPRRSVYELLTRTLSTDARLEAGLAALLAGPSRRGLGLATAPLRLFQAGEPLALLPQAILGIN